jgi:hypothetical protein
VGKRVYFKPQKTIDEKGLVFQMAEYQKIEHFV